MSFIRLGLLTALTALSGQFALAAAQTNLDAAATDAKSSAVQAGVTFLLDNVNQFTVTTAVQEKLVAAPLTDAEIEAIVSITENSPLSGLGLGTAGGPRVTITYDEGQAARAAGVQNSNALAESYKMQSADALRVEQSTAGVAGDAIRNQNVAELEPKYQTVEINPNLGDVKARLTELSTAKVPVKVVTFRGVLARGVSKVAGTLQAVFVVGAASNALNAARYAYSGITEDVDSWKADQCTTVGAAGAKQQACPQPTLWNRWLNSAVYYTFQPDEVAK